MKYLFIILFLLPTLLFGQNDDKRSLSFILGTSQGVSFLTKEAKSNTYDKTFDVSPAYAFSYGMGLSITSKNKKAFSEITLNYRSNSNGIKEITDTNSPNGLSNKISFDRYNYLTLDYRYARYIGSMKQMNPFISIGVKSSFILNEKLKLNYTESSQSIKIKGSNISDNFVLTTTPTFLLSFGLDLNKHSRLSLDFDYDLFLLGLASSPSNQYFSTALNYRVLL